MSIRVVDHINVVSEKLEETRDFYVSVLKLREGWRPAFESEGYWFYAGDHRWCIFKQAAATVGPSRACALNQAAFRVDDLDSLLASLQAYGISFREQRVPGTAIRQAFFEDPNGVRLELSYDPDTR